MDRPTPFLLNFLAVVQLWNYGRSQFLDRSGAGSCKMTVSSPYRLPLWPLSRTKERTNERRKERCLSLQSGPELAQKGFNGMMAMAVARTTPTPIMPSLLSPFAMDAPRREGLLTPLMHSTLSESDAQSEGKEQKLLVNCDWGFRVWMPELFSDWNVFKRNPK